MITTKMNADDLRLNLESKLSTITNLLHLQALVANDNFFHQRGKIETLNRRLEKFRHPFQVSLYALRKHNCADVVEVSPALNDALYIFDDEAGAIQDVRTDINEYMARK